MTASTTAPAMRVELAELQDELDRLRSAIPEHIDVDPDGVERSLARLVLSLVEFLRQVLERQAVRRMESGTLDDDEVERVGVALMRLERRIGELCDAFQVSRDDLAIRIGAVAE